MDRYIMHRGEPLMDNDDLFGYAQEAASAFDTAEDFIPIPGVNLPIPGVTIPFPGGGTSGGGTPSPGTGSGTGGNTTGGGFDVTKTLSAIQSAPMTDACRVRVNGIISSLMALKPISADDAVWIQRVAAGAQGQGEMPPECVPDSGWPWYVWAGGGALVVTAGTLIYISSKKKRKGRKK